MKKKIKKYLITNQFTLSKALRRMSFYGIRTLIVVNKYNKYMGTLADGDVRRSLIKNSKLSDEINKIFNKKSFFFRENNISKKKINFLFSVKKIDIIPVLNKKNEVINIINYFDIKLSLKKKIKKKIIPNTSVIIMAGGKGTRLLPYTRVLPKPLIPVGNKTLIEHVIDQFTIHRLKKFIFTINYKALIFKAFFKELNPNIKFRYVEENKPLGTAGSLSKIKTQGNKYFFITTCDTVIKTNYEKIFDFHQNNKSDITIVGAKILNKIPYGVLKHENKNVLTEFKEKPTSKHIVNT